MAGRIVSADEARGLMASADRDLQIVTTETYNFAHTVVELTAQLDAANARADAAEAKVRAVEALPASVDGSGGRAWVVAGGDLRRALATPEAQS